MSQPRIPLVALLLLAGCVSTPTGPMVMILPAHGKTLNVFHDDQIVCKNSASEEVAGEAGHADWMQAVVAGGATLLGAGIGGVAGGGKGALIGAGVGAAGGGAASYIPGSKAQSTIQQRYDAAYAQCMFTRGNQVPGFERAAKSQKAAR